MNGGKGTRTRGNENDTKATTDKESRPHIDRARGF